MLDLISECVASAEQIKNPITLFMANFHFIRNA